MIRNDYILRLVEELTNQLMHVMRLVGESGAQAALETSDGVLHHYFGLGSASLLTVEPEELLSLLQLRDEMAVEERAMYIAAMFDQEATLYEQLNDDDSAFERRLHALHIVLAVFASDPDFAEPDYTPNIDHLYEWLAHFMLPPLTYVNLIAHYERYGRFADAESVLVSWIDAESDEEDDMAYWEAVETGVQLYGRLGQLTPSTLEAGGLTIEEVREGVAELVALQDEDDDGEH